MAHGVEKLVLGGYVPGKPVGESDAGDFKFIRDEIVGIVDRPENPRANTLII